MVKVLCYKSESRWFDPSFRLVCSAVCWVCDGISVPVMRAAMHKESYQLPKFGEADQQQKNSTRCSNYEASEDQFGPRTNVALSSG